MTRTVRLVLVAVVLVAIIALGWFFLITPIRSEIVSTTAQIESAKADLSAAQAKLARAEDTRTEGKKNQARLIELAKMIPPTQEMESLLVQIQELASQAGIDFMSISPGEPLGDTVGFQIIPLSVQFSGTFFDLSDFVYRAEQMVAGPGRLLAVKQMKIELANVAGAGTSGSKSVSPELDVAMTIYAFDTAPSEDSAIVPNTATSSSSATDTTSTTSPNGA